MEKEKMISEAMKDVEFAKKIIGIQSPEEMQKAFATKEIELSLEEAQAIISTIKKLAKNESGELSEDDLEGVAGGIDLEKIEKISIATAAALGTMVAALTLNGALLFDSGSATIKEGAYPILDKIGVILQKYGENLIEIEGHTDNIPIHNAQFANNNELSSARALSVFDYLVETTTLNPANIKHTGRGEYVPVDDNSTPEGRSKNRRVEIKIYHTLSTY